MIKKTVHDKVRLVEAEVLQMKENFERNNQESMEKELKQQSGKEKKN